jgi:hypothetical protein
MRTIWRLLTVVFLASLPAIGQNITTLEGSVYDPAGAVVPGTLVTLTNEATGASRSIETAADGTYLFVQVPPGRYTVRLEVQGFKTAVREHVEVVVATPARLDITLELGAVSETITVEATAAGVNTWDSTVGLSFSELEIKQLPLSARNPVDLLTLEPGVVFTGSSDTDLLFQGSTRDLDPREGAVNGVRGDQTNITLDGADVNDFQNQAAFTSGLPLSLDSLQEFRVTTTNANAPQGGAGGAQVAMVTKSGSNAFHGNLRWFHRNTATAANSFFNNRSGVSKPKLIRNIFGFSVGGPIVEDRAFFFTDWEGRRDASAENVTRIVPTETMKQGVVTYEVDQSVPGFNPSAPGLMPCPNDPSRLCRQLSLAEFAALDPGCATTPSAGCGVNPAMLAYWNQFAVGNDPTQGLDSGLNFTGLRFNAPIDTNNNVYALRLDFNITRDGRHATFWRGNLADIKTDILPAQFPGRPPASTLFNNSKGFVASYTGQFRPTLINTFRWGFTRVGIAQTGVKGAFLTALSFSDVTNFNRAFGRRVPTHQLKDDLTWIHRKHIIQGGFDTRLPRNNFFTEEISFPDFQISNGPCMNLCRDPFFALQGDGDPSNNPVNENAFIQAFVGLTGSITGAQAAFFVDPISLTFLPTGSTQKRRFAENDFEWYLQDTWRVRSDLTFTIGIRYSYFGPVWERDGSQTRPVQDLRDWWNQRQFDMAAGIPSDASPLLEFELAGKSNGRTSYYEPDKNNWAPRVSLAYSPGFDSGLLGKFFGGPGKSSIRAGFSIFHQRIGGAVAFTNALNGDPGLGGRMRSGFRFGLDDAPRFSGSCDASGCTGLPPVSDFLSLPTSTTFPAVPPTGFSPGFKLLTDNNLSQPYTMNFAFSIQRELPKGLTVDAGYVGTLGRQLLLKSDFGQYFGLLADPASGQNLWGAFNQIVDQIDASTPISAVSPVAFFENLMPNMADTSMTSDCDPSLTAPTATQGFFCQAFLGAPSWSDVLFFLDVILPQGFGFTPWSAAIDPEGNGLPGPGLPGSVLFQPQFGSAPTWTNAGSSNFHSFQLSVSRKAGDSQFAFNYVFSKSIDNGSAAPNADSFLALINGQIPNAFSTKAHRAVSDFDLRHNFNAHWVAPLPFGMGKALGRGVSSNVNRIIGGWQILGSWRWHSGFPLSPRNGLNFPTNFFQQNPATVIGPLGSDVTRNDPSGVPNLFEDPAAARQMLRFTRPGAEGSRNVIRGDDFFRLDLGISKFTTTPWNENHRIQFRVEFFNLFNNVNFDSTASQFSTTFAGGIAPIDGFDLQEMGPFGRLFATAGPRGGAREIQFALRYEF